MIDRRQLLRAIGGSTVAVGAGSLAGVALAANVEQTVTLPFANGKRPLVQYPQKRPLIRLTTRPPQLETPMSVFDEGVLTPNDAFFVRYHLAEAPPQSLYLDPDAYKFEVKGKVDTLLTISLNDLKTQFEPVEIVAVNECSGNSRGFFEPRVAGGQAGNGLMGNARWKGVPLKAVLDKAGVQADAKQVSFDGYDGPATPATPDFAKALDIDHARDGEVMLAYAMNGAALPVLNGNPVRLIVPGYYGTYWVKHVSEITILDHEFDSFWMKTAYRIPANLCACVPPGTAPKSTTPINRLNVRSFITNLSNGAKLAANREVIVKGIAFDGGYGISEVVISTDGGSTWTDTKLGSDLGKYSFREWQAAVKLAPGAHALKISAVNRIGQSQPMEPLWNPAGYMRNSVETVNVTAA
jgi:sulfite dehydrogenase (cytochrome) subunit A